MSSGVFNAHFSDLALQQVERFSAFQSTWNELLHVALAHEAYTAAMEHMKPLMHVRTDVPHTGALEASLVPHTTMRGDGFETEFYGLFYGLYMDDGNDSLGEALASNYGLKTFPVDVRHGSQYYKPMSVIHPMGSHTPGAPTHYSEKTAEWLAGDSGIGEMAMKYMETWLEGVIVR